MGDFEKRKRAILEPIYFEAGATLHVCQSFEWNIAYLMFLLSRMGVEGLQESRTVAILEDEEKKTAGQLVKLLQKHAQLSAGIEDALRGALVARNKFIHRYFMDNIERFLEPDEPDKIVEEIRSLRRDVAKVHQVLGPIIDQIALKVDGIDHEKLSDEFLEEFMRKTEPN